MRNKRIVSLLGCGWLGFPLGISLLERGYAVKGTTRTSDKLIRMKNAGIDPYLVHFSPLEPDPDLMEFLKADMLIISIPPGGKSIQGGGNYQKMIETLAT